jgi:hypothetical protein
MLMELLGRSSPAPAHDVARRILGEDMTQIKYTTESPPIAPATAAQSAARRKSELVLPVIQS